ncbi:putative phage prohead protease [Anaplasma centrale str. Israel]|uniref:Putative phage prohead protease n=1 Tax=Anaplasma centrale (strain Israel) TaxID=574556 RepID=D1ATC7_ANACI|nr:putative phage prohead protease [Anaplasma centrale str. Israel]
MYIVKNSKKHEHGSFVGYASVFNKVDAHNDVIKPGAFAESLQKRKVALLWQHSIKDPIGKILDAREDSFGLLVVAKLNLGLRLAREVYALITDGSVNALSIGYKVVQSRRDSKSGVRMISKIDLWEVSVVTFPANEMAKISTVKALHVPIAAAGRLFLTGS